MDTHPDGEAWAREEISTLATDARLKLSYDLINTLQK